MVRRIEIVERAMQIILVALVDERRRRDQLLMETIDVVRVIDAERRLNDGKLHDEFDTRGAAEPEIRSRLKRQITVGDASTWKMRCEVLNPSRVQAQAATLNNAVGSSIEK